MINRTLSFMVAITCFPLCAASQLVKETNPIAFGDIFVGHAWAKPGGLAAGASLNYQIKRSLLTLRYNETIRLHVDFLSVFIPIPVIEQRSHLKEAACLYGWRFISDGNAYSFSLGPSYNVFTERLTDGNNRTANYGGLCFEANIKWFKKEKRRFRIYGLFPVGNETGFSGSIGFKLFGNISKYSYAGVGLTFGSGFHKQY